MIRVLQVIGDFSRGGLETFVVNVYRKIDRSIIQFDFLVNSQKGDYYQEVLELGAHVYVIPPRNRGVLAHYKALHLFFKENAHSYAAVHVHASSLSSLAVLRFAKHFGIKNRILHSHSTSISGSKVHYLTHYFNKLFVSQCANHYLGCSNQAVAWFYSHTKALKHAIVIPNGIDTSLYVFNPAIRNEVRKELGIPIESVVIGHVGRFMWSKNHAYLVDIFNSYLNYNQNAFLILVGDGPLIDAIREKVNKLQIEQKVLFLGLRGDVNRILQAMDIFVMPSVYEGLPLVLVEAESSGLPVLCSDTISTDSRLVSSFYQMSLNNEHNAWAKQIDIILSTYTRYNTREEIIKKGFDILSTVQQLSCIYTK